MNKTLMRSVNSTYDTLVAFFYMASSLFFMYIAIFSKKYVYILLGITIYIVTLILRKYVMQKRAGNNVKSSYTELGMFFLSFLLLAYILSLIEADTSLEKILPNALIIQSAFNFIFIFIITFIVKNINSSGKFYWVIILIVTSMLMYFNQSFISSFIDRNSTIIRYIIGAPIFHILITISGADIYFGRFEK